MAMTKAELAKQLEALQAQYDDMDDEEEEVWVKVDGAEFKLTGAKAKSFLNKHKSHWEEVVEDVQNETEAEIKPARKTAAKKTAAPRKAAKPVSKDIEEELDDINDIIEEEAEDTAPRRFF